MGSQLGVMKVAAKRLGLSLEEYSAKLVAGLKWCIRCKSWKSVGEFGTDQSRSGGKASCCGTCRANGISPGPGKFERRRMKAAGLAWCRTCHAWKPMCLVHAGLCRPCINVATRTRYATDLHYRLDRRQRIHSRKRSVAPIPADAQLMILEEFGGKCAYCRVADATTWDHIVPISRWGRTAPGNVVPACASCNSSKKDRNVWEWMEGHGLTPSDEFLDRYILSDCGLFG